MKWFGNNLRSLRRWRSAAADVREEMHLHAELRTRDLVSRGLPAEEAQARAAREVGLPAEIAPGVARLAEATDRASAVRQWRDELAQDVSYAVRSFGRSRGFTTLALLTIALGLGANTAIFGVVNAVFLAPLPFDPDNTLVRVREYRTGTDGRQMHVDASWRTADAVAGRRDLFSGAVATSLARRALARDGGPIRVDAARVGPGFTAVAAIDPAIGRTFTAQEEHAGEDSGVALISHRLWQTLLGGDEAVLRQSIQLDGRPFAIVGVLPRGFQVPYGADVWFPSRFAGDERSIFILARLAPGVTLRQAQAGLEPLGPALNAAYPDVLRGLGVTAVRLRDYFVGDETRVAAALMGAVAFLLLIACSNVALLLTARFAARRKEVAVRAALGCGRGRQIRQFVTESLLLFTAGGLLGLVCAIWLKDWLVVFLPEDMTTQAGIQSIAIDGRVLVFGALVALVTGTAFGLISALRAAQADPGEILKAGSRSISGDRRRLLGRLVVAEVALALVLLSAAGLMADTFQQLSVRDLGFEPDGVLTMAVDLNAPRYESADARRAFVGEALERIRALLQVEAAGATTVNPLCCGNWGIGITAQGHTPPSAQVPVVRHFIVTPGYFETMRQPLVEGRAFSDADVDGAEMAVVVNEAFARRFWPGESALAKRVKRGPPDSAYPWLTVVGVVATAWEEGDYTESWYLPYAQHPTGPSAENAHLMVRASGDPAGLAAAARTIAGDLDPHLAPRHVRTMDAIRLEHLQQVRLGTVVTGMFAIAGLLLAALGLYGVLSFTVAQDAREIAMRIALGAAHRDVVRFVVGRGAALTAVGIGIGAAIAWTLARVLSASLDDVAFDPRVIVIGAALLLAAALLATLLPAYRALRLDPLRALQVE
jgi:putative ABC transport system permease protein